MPAATNMTPFIFTPPLGIQTASLRMGCAASRGGSAQIAWGNEWPSVWDSAGLTRASTATKIFPMIAVGIFIVVSKKDDAIPNPRVPGESLRFPHGRAKYPVLLRTFRSGCFRRREIFRKVSSLIGLLG